MAGGPEGKPFSITPVDVLSSGMIFSTADTPKIIIRSKPTDFRGADEWYTVFWDY
jgi:hypothetical protein